MLGNLLGCSPGPPQPDVMAGGHLPPCHPTAAATRKVPSENKLVWARGQTEVEHKRGVCARAPACLRAGRPSANREAVFCSQANRRPVSTTGQAGPPDVEPGASTSPVLLGSAARRAWAPSGPVPLGACPGALPVGGSTRALSRPGQGKQRHCVLAWVAPSPEPQVASCPGLWWSPCPALALPLWAQRHRRSRTGEAGRTPGVESSLGLVPCWSQDSWDLLGHAGGDAQTCRLGGAVGGHGQ